MKLLNGTGFAIAGTTPSFNRSFFARLALHCDRLTKQSALKSATQTVFLGKSWIKCPYYLTDLSEMGVQRIGVSLIVRGAAHTFTANQKHTEHFWSASFWIIKSKIVPSTVVLMQIIKKCEAFVYKSPWCQNWDCFLWKTTNPVYHSYQLIWLFIEGLTHMQMPFMSSEASDNIDLTQLKMLIMRCCCCYILKT